MKIRLVAAELFHVGRMTDITRLRVAFRNFAYAPKNELLTDELRKQLGFWQPKVNINLYTTCSEEARAGLTAASVRRTVS